MSIDELYTYVRQRIAPTGGRLIHLDIEDGVTEFTQEEADELVSCILSAREAERKEKHSIISNRTIIRLKNI